MNVFVETDDKMNAEIEELKKSPYVALARKEQRLKYRKRQYLYSLRNLEKRGKQLTEQGITADQLEHYIEQLECDENE